MPCRSDYPCDTPSQAQLRWQDAAKFIVYIYNVKGIHVPTEVVQASLSPYSSREKHEIALCKILSGMDDAEIKAIVYNPYDRVARDLATWWEDHQAMDKERIARENEQARLKKLRLQALAKLTLEELAALGIIEEKK